MNKLGRRGNELCMYASCLWKKNSSAHGHNLEIHCKETMPELTETCPNQDVISDKKLTDVCHFGQNIVNSDIFCQLFVTLDNFLSIYFLSFIMS